MLNLNRMYDFSSDSEVVHGSVSQKHSVVPVQCTGAIPRCHTVRLQHHCMCLQFCSGVRCRPYRLLIILTYCLCTTRGNRPSRLRQLIGDRVQFNHCTLFNYIFHVVTATAGCHLSTCNVPTTAHIHGTDLLHHLLCRCSNSVQRFAVNRV